MHCRVTAVETEKRVFVQSPRVSGYSIQARRQFVSRFFSKQRSAEGRGLWESENESRNWVTRLASCLGFAFATKQSDSCLLSAPTDRQAGCPRRATSLPNRKRAVMCSRINETRVRRRPACTHGRTTGQTKVGGPRTKVSSRFRLARHAYGKGQKERGSAFWWHLSLDSPVSSSHAPPGETRGGN